METKIFFWSGVRVYSSIHLLPLSPWTGPLPADAGVRRGPLGTSPQVVLGPTHTDQQSCRAVTSWALFSFLCDGFRVKEPTQTCQNSGNEPLPSCREATAWTTAGGSEVSVWQNEPRLFLHSSSRRNSENILKRRSSDRWRYSPKLTQAPSRHSSLVHYGMSPRWESHLKVHIPPSWCRPRPAQHSNL